eukprot:TRINITY_DN57101_c0_g1_i4.p1 TRINITY_DN57101_c0_g1~~TRINITY_DN57101_c0_g1_i4.p1  ORF type:complete len:216 (+),score=9.67 TRINITY_DN57101_c0_g1_i4:119-766(+)
MTYYRSSKKCLSLLPGAYYSFEQHELFLDSCEITLYHWIVCKFTEDITNESFNRSMIMPFTTTPFSSLVEQRTMTRCRDGHVTYTFLLCDSSQHRVCGEERLPPCTFSTQFSNTDRSDVSDHHMLTVPTFTCSDDFTKLSYTVVCDFIADCQDKSDESFCKYPPCINMFRCSNGQCLSHYKVCDYISHCMDKSDEMKCFTPVSYTHLTLPTIYSV